VLLHFNLSGQEEISQVRNPLRSGRWTLSPLLRFQYTVFLFDQFPTCNSAGVYKQIRLESGEEAGTEVHLPERFLSDLRDLLIN
jgi:hypothetical protein